MRFRSKMVQINEIAPNSIRKYIEIVICFWVL